MDKKTITSRLSKNRSILNMTREKASIEQILDDEFNFITKEDKLTPEDVKQYEAHTQYLESQGYKIGLFQPDKKHFHLSLYNSDNDKIQTKRYEK